MTTRAITAAGLALALALASSPAFAQTPAPTGQGFLPGIFGCSAPGGKQGVGAVVGGVLGGVAGNQISKRNKTLGTVLGAAVGAGVGSWIGCKMQRGDQEKAQAAAERAIANGQNQTWSNPETGARGAVNVVNEGGGGTVSLSNLKFAPGVSPVSSYTAVSGTYTAASTANLRAAPTTKARITGKLASGQQVDVVAGVANSPWLLVSQGGLATGYVSASLLRSLDGGMVQAANTCRLVTEEISTADGGTQQTRYRACRTPEGGWQLSNA
jgi:surface antigen